MKPLIGINMDVKAGPPTALSVHTYYLEAIQQSGGIPFMLAPMVDGDLDQVLASLSGLMLIGGRDYCPSRYGQKSEPTVDLTHPLREDFDFRLVQRVLKTTNLPILGICAGMQLLNIASGGSLIQDIGTTLLNSPVQHESKDGWNKGFHKHLVKFEKGTQLGDIYSIDSLDVPTSHHQAILELGEGWKATAFAEDGVIEGIELPSRNFTIGVQWHPERDFAASARLFEGLIRSARGGKVSTSTRTRARKVG